MMEKPRIRKGLMFWFDTEKAIAIHEGDLTIIYENACLYEVEKCDGFSVLCSSYAQKWFGQEVVFPIDYLVMNAKEVRLEDSDRQEIVDIYNAIFIHNAYKGGDWSLEIPNELQRRIDNFLCPDFYRKYRLKDRRRN